MNIKNQHKIINCQKLIHYLWDKVLGGDVDPNFAFINIRESLFQYCTEGPNSFFDECYWIADSTFIIVGCSFLSDIRWDYSEIIIVEGDLQQGVMRFYRSNRLPYNKNWNSWVFYMRHKYAKFYYPFIK